jgi:hypothetical protein
LRIKKVVMTTIISYSGLAVSTENELQEVTDLGCIDEGEVDEQKGIGEIKSALSDMYNAFIPLKADVDQLSKGVSETE